MSSLTLADQARLHTWLPVSVRFSIAPVVAFHNLTESEDVTGHVYNHHFANELLACCMLSEKVLMLINVHDDCCLDRSRVIQQ